jgi:hypothetical protein
MERTFGPKVRYMSMTTWPYRALDDDPSVAFEPPGVTVLQGMRENGDVMMTDQPRPGSIVRTRASPPAGSSSPSQLPCIWSCARAASRMIRARSMFLRTLMLVVQVYVGFLPSESVISLVTIHPFSRHHDTEHDNRHLADHLFETGIDREGRSPNGTSG